MTFVLRGEQRKILEVGGSTIRIIKEGGLFRSDREKTIPIRNVTSVKVKKFGPLIVGFIQLSIAGGIARDSSYTLTGGSFGALLDENSVIFKDPVSYKVAVKIKEYVQDYSEVGSHNSGSSVSKADEIQKLKGLLDEGILTEEEFNLEKKKLLEI